MPYNGDVAIETGVLDRTVVGNIIASQQADIAQINAGFTPAQWDVVALNTVDGEYYKYDAGVATHEPIGIVREYDATEGDFILITNARQIDVAKLGIANYATNEEAVARALKLVNLEIL